MPSRAILAAYHQYLDEYALPTMTTTTTIATFNTRGLPLRGSRIAERFKAIAAELDASDIDVVCLQEVYTYRHLSHLRTAMPSFPHLAYRKSIPGPAGGLVTLSRHPLTSTTYAHLPRPPRRPKLPTRSRLNAQTSTLHPDLYQHSGLRDAFDGQCPPTFHPEYLPPGSTPHCIDFILTTNPIEVHNTDLLFTKKRPLPSGPTYLSDHIGLQARLQIPANFG